MFIDLADTRVYVEQSGKGEALVLLHGFTDSGRNWLPIVPALDSSYLVTRPDARGHGLSARLEHEFTLDDLVTDVIGVLDGLGIAKAALLGHSMGASTAARVASLHPDRITRLVLEDPAWRRSKPATGYTPNPFESFIRDFPNASPDEQFSLARASNPDWGLKEIPFWIESKVQLDLACFRSQHNIPGPNWRDDVRGIRCSATLIVGDHERGAIVSAEIAEEAESLCPTLFTVHIPGAGHNIRREQGAAYLAAVRSALTK
jgi:N-formylmaleamate deformylase